MGKTENFRDRVAYERESDALVARALSWWIWKAVVPAVLLTALWPIYTYILALPHAFQRAFAHGDFLLLSALLMLELTVEGDHVARQKMSFRFLAAGSKAAAFVLMFVYGFVKYDVVTQEARLAAAALNPDIEATILDKLRAYSCFNCSVMLCAIFACILVSSALIEHQRQEQLERFGLV